MNQRMNEEVAWERLKDMQNEAEQSRLTAGYRLPGIAALFAGWAWRLGGLVTRRRASRANETAECDDTEAATDAA